MTEDAFVTQPLQDNKTFCVVCGKTMQPLKDSGVSCLVCEKVSSQPVRYCFLCGTDLPPADKFARAGAIYCDRCYLEKQTQLAEADVPKPVSKRPKKYPPIGCELRWDDMRDTGVWETATSHRLRYRE